MVFISAEGDRVGRLDPNFTEIALAISASATFVTDDKQNRERPYNVGERQVAEFLIDHNYEEVKPGFWQSCTVQDLRVVQQFSGKFDFLSNFYPCEVEFDGVIYPSAEHAYQAAKTVDPEERTRILNAPTPGKAKRLGARVTLVTNWEQVKLQVMHSIVYSKFIQNIDLAAKLQHVAGLHLEEGNNWGDTFWGISPVGSGVGENHLGIILMDVAKALNGQFPDKVEAVES